MVDDRGRNAERLGACKARGFLPVGHHQHDFGRIRRLLGGLNQRGHVGAAPGNQDGDALAGHALTR
jgi:hypothetical protein